jgi:hypothetical protein
LLERRPLWKAYLLIIIMEDDEEDIVGYERDS